MMSLELRISRVTLNMLMRRRKRHKTMETREVMIISMRAKKIRRKALTKQRETMIMKGETRMLIKYLINSPFPLLLQCCISN